LRKNFLALLAGAFIILACSPKEQPNKKPDPLSKIAFGSCGDQRLPQPVIDRVARRKPDLFIYLGDNIYSDTDVIDTLEENYRKLVRKREFQALKASTPILATWDDHDFGLNDAGRHYALKEQSKILFLQTFGVPDSAMLNRKGIYYSKIFSGGEHTVQIIFPDTRTFRDKLLAYTGDKKDDSRFNYQLDYSAYTTEDSTLLGEDQWKWIDEQLKVPADLRIIASSTQFGITFNGYESWANFPHEQRRMLELIKKNKASGVMFISGDVHYAEISKLNEPGLYPIYDVTSSGITSRWDFATPNDNRIEGPVMENHYGLLTIDWKEKDPSIHMRIYDVDDKERIHHTIHLSELQFKDPQ
jgi:alkaline phosphatase D